MRGHDGVIQRDRHTQVVASPRPKTSFNRLKSVSLLRLCGRFPGPASSTLRPRRLVRSSLLDVGERQLAIGVGDVLHLIETRQSVTHM